MLRPDVVVAVQRLVSRSQSRLAQRSPMARAMASSTAPWRVAGRVSVVSISAPPGRRAWCLPACSLGSRRRPRGCRRPGRRGRPVTTFSTVKPKRSKICSAGRRGPKRSMAMMAPSVADPAVPAQRDAGLDADARGHAAAAGPRRGRPPAAPRSAPSWASRRRACGCPRPVSTSRAAMASASSEPRGDEDELGSGRRVPSAVAASART